MTTFSCARPCRVIIRLQAEPRQEAPHQHDAVIDDLVVREMLGIADVHLGLGTSRISAVASPVSPSNRPCQCNAIRYIPPPIKSFRSRALKRCRMKSDASGRRPEWAQKVQRRLELLDRATQATDMNVVTFGFHALNGDLTGRFAVTESKNWRLTFAFDSQNVVDIDLEDYHGK